MRRAKKCSACHGKGGELVWRPPVSGYFSSSLDYVECEQCAGTGRAEVQTAYHDAARAGAAAAKGSE